MKMKEHRARNCGTALIALALLIAAALGCNITSDEEWVKGLAHKKLTRAETSGAISDRIDIYFCPNGEYAKQTQFTGFSGGGAGTLSMADEQTELGRWTVTGGVLYLQSQEGNRSEYTLSQGMDAEVVQLNGDGFLVTTHRECQ